MKPAAFYSVMVFGHSTQFDGGRINPLRDCCEGLRYEHIVIRLAAGSLSSDEEFPISDLGDAVS
jgi:hypothetical protein